MKKAKPSPRRKKSTQLQWLVLGIPASVDSKTVDGLVDVIRSRVKTKPKRNDPSSTPSERKELVVRRASRQERLRAGRWVILSGERADRVVKRKAKPSETSPA